MAGTTGGWTAVDEPTQGWTPIDEEDQLTKKTNATARAAGVGVFPGHPDATSFNTASGKTLKLQQPGVAPPPPDLENAIGKHQDIENRSAAVQNNSITPVTNASSIFAPVGIHDEIAQHGLRRVALALLRGAAKSYVGSKAGKYLGRDIGGLFGKDAADTGEKIGEYTGAITGPMIPGSSFAKLPMGLGRLAASNEEYAAELASRKLAQRNADLAVGLRTSKPVDDVASAVRNRTANWIPSKIPQAPDEVAAAVRNRTANWIPTKVGEAPVTPMTESPYYNEYAAAQSNAREDAANKAMNRPGWTAKLPSRINTGNGAEGYEGADSRQPRAIILPGEEIDPKRIKNAGSAAQATAEDLQILAKHGDMSAKQELTRRRLPMEGSRRGIDFSNIPLPPGGSEYSPVGPKESAPTGEMPVGNKTPFESERRGTPRATALNSSPVDPIREARVNDLRKIVRDPKVPERDRYIAQAQLNDMEANPGERNELGDNPAKLKKAKPTMSREEAESEGKKRSAGKIARFKEEADANVKKMAEEGKKRFGDKIPKKQPTAVEDSESMNDPDTRFTAAKHEAGHAVIGELLRPGSVENSSLGERGGETNVTPPSGKTAISQLNRDELHDMLTESFAGGMSEDGGTTVKHASGDREVRNKLTGSRASTPVQNASRFAFGRTFNDPMLQAPNAQAAARAKVTALLADPKTHDLINSVAEKLSLGGKLSGDEIRQILNTKAKRK